MLSFFLRASVFEAGRADGQGSGIEGGIQSGASFKWQILYMVLSTVPLTLTQGKD